MSFYCLPSNVYFGISSAAVESADTSSPEFMSNQTGNIFDPGQLSSGKGYYWRIDKVTPSKTYKGNVWSFTPDEEMPVEIPAGVSVKVSGPEVTVTGPIGELAYSVPGPITVAVEGGLVKLGRADDTRESKSFHGLARSLVANMLEGVEKGFSKTLDIEGVGFRGELQGRKLVLSLGFSGPTEFTPPEGVDIKLEGNTIIVVSGADKQKVGESAARIRAFFPAEPYKGKGIRYRGEQVKRKVGKTVA